MYDVFINRSDVLLDLDFVVTTGFAVLQCASTYFWVSVFSGIEILGDFQKYDQKQTERAPLPRKSMTPFMKGYLLEVEYIPMVDELSSGILVLIAAMRNNDNGESLPQAVY